MKKNVFILGLLLFAVQLNAQICDPPCTPDISCVDVESPGQICPEELPAGHENEYYDETVTVIPPATFNILGDDYDILKMSVDSVNGLPNGVDWCKSHEFFTNNPDDPNYQDSYCCQLTGTPTQVGEYQLILKITPYYEFFGTEYALPQQTDDTSLLLVVLPAVLGADFSADMTEAETGVDIAFTDESTGNPNSWAWEFENGTPSTSDVQNPIVQWDTEGVYDVVLVISDGEESNTLTMTDYITIDNGAGVNESLIKKVKLYPNPASHQITVEAVGLESVSIVDMLGKVVYAQDANSTKQVIDISKLGKANYFVKIVTTDGEITKSISIK